MIRGSVNYALLIEVQLEVIGPTGQTEMVDCVIDTGFSDFMVLPPDLIERLGLEYYGTGRYELGDGEQVDFDLYTAVVTWDGVRREVLAVSSKGGALVGMAMLHGYHLSVGIVDGGEVLVTRLP